MVTSKETYLIWALGGLFGFHHLYLGRLTHAIFFAITFGFFGIGWIYDFTQIPTYVKQANGDPIYLSLLRKRIHQRPTPSIPRALSLYISAYCSAHLSLTLIGPFEPIESRIGEMLYQLPLWWIILISVIQIIAILIGCMMVNSIGGQRTVSKSYLLLPIIIGTIVDVLLAILLQARVLVAFRALLPTIFYLRSCEWLPACAASKPRYANNPLRFLKLFIPYLFVTLFIYTMVFGSLYFYTDVFLSNDGSIEYSDTNYGIGFSSDAILSQLPWETPSFKPHRFPSTNNLQSQQDQNDDPYSNIQVGTADRLVIEVSKPNSTQSPHSQNLPHNNNNNNNNAIPPIDSRPGHQPQYTYTQFKSELRDFYTSYTALIQTRRQPTSTSTSTRISDVMNHFSLPFSYRFRDILRNIYFSSILKPVHSDINYYDPTYSPGSDPLFHGFVFPTTFSVGSFVNQLVTQTYSKTIFLARCIYYFWVNSSQFVQENGVPALISELDARGHSWALSFLTYINHGKQVASSTPLTPAQTAEMNSVVAKFIYTTLSSVHGDVTTLKYWQQKAIYDAIIAHGRLTPPPL